MKKKRIKNTNQTSFYFENFLETNKKNGLDVEKLSLGFSKDTYYSNKIKLQLDKNFHLSIEEAIKKYNELQKILKDSL